METKNLIKFCNIALIAIVIYVVASMMNLTHNIIKFADSQFAWYDLVADLSILLLIIVCSVMFILLTKNVKAGKVLTIQNEKIIKISYEILGFIGIAELIAVGLLSDKGIFRYDIVYVMIIVAFLLKFFQLIMSIARKMKEENDLTV